MHRTVRTAVPAAILGLTAAVMPSAAAPAHAASQSLGSFQRIQASAQGQAGTGYFFAVGKEENRLVGALSEINGPPGGASAIAALLQPGVAASYTYGTAGGGGPGQNGTLPQPMPGVAQAFFPAEPREAKVEGPLTLGTGGTAIDGRFHASASEKPTGSAEAAVTDFDAEAFAVEDVDVVSRTLPDAHGVLAESITVLRGVTIGPLRIESLISHARGFVPADGSEPVGIARTVVYGATVNGVGVQITDQGIVANDSQTPGVQKQINDSLASAGYSDMRLTGSVVTIGADKQSIVSSAGVLQVLYQDDALGASNSQGFSGGGFSVGGADTSVLGQRAR